MVKTEEVLDCFIEICLRPYVFVFADWTCDIVGLRLLAVPFLRGFFQDSCKEKVA